MVSLESSSLYYLNILNEQNSKVNYQLNSNNAIENGSDDSSLFKEIISIENKLSKLSVVEEQIDNSSLYNNSSDSTISEMKDILDSIKSEVMLAINSTVSTDDKAIIANELETYKESLLNLANESADDYYLFSGLTTTQKPFSENEDGNIIYNGSLEYKQLLIDENTYTNQGINGVDVLYYTTNKASNSDELSFKENDIIVDSNDNTWEFIDYDLDGNIDTDRVYLNADDNSGYLDVTYNTTTNTYTLTNTEDITIETKHSYFDLLDELINTLNLEDSDSNDITNSESSDILSDSLEQLDNAYNSMNEAHAMLGNRSSVIENASSVLLAKQTNYEVFYEEVASADLTEASIKAQSLELTFTALYSSISKLNSLSLVNYI